MTVDRPEPGPGFPTASVLGDEWDDPTGPYDLLLGAAVLGRRIDVERQLHVALGTWAARADVARTVTTFDRVAMRHAWRADVLTARLPRLRELPVDRVLGQTPHEPGHAEPTDDDARIDAWTGSALRLLDDHRDHLTRCTPVADAPLRRWLPLVISSLQEDLDAMAALRT